MNTIIYIACDNKNKELGHFFQSCHDKICAVANKNKLNYKSLTTQQLTKKNINSHISSTNECIFSAFSHGTNDSLLCGKTPYIEKDNVRNFYNSIFYTFACYTANGLGKELKHVRVAGYFGYNNRAWVIPCCENMFTECAIKGLISYMEGKTLKEAEADLIAEYDKHIKNLGINPISSYLLKNKQALVTIINDQTKPYDKHIKYFPNYIKSCLRTIMTSTLRKSDQLQIFSDNFPFCIYKDQHYQPIDNAIL